MTTSPTHDPARIRLDIPCTELLGSLRASLGLPPDEPHPDEDAGTVDRSLPDVLDGLDPGAWLAWAKAGLLLFSQGTLPTVRNAASTGRRVTLALAMERSCGNISASAKALGTSRKMVRDHLRAEGLYHHRWSGERVKVSTEAFVAAGASNEEACGTLV
jgi:hypothetical protein